MTIPVNKLLVRFPNCIVYQSRGWGPWLGRLPHWTMHEIVWVDWLASKKVQHSALSRDQSLQHSNKLHQGDFTVKHAVLLHQRSVSHIARVDASQISQCNANIQFAGDKMGCSTFQSAIINFLIPIQMETFWNQTIVPSSPPASLTPPSPSPCQT